MPYICNGHTWIANELIEEVFARGRFSKRESQIIWIILRDSWGWIDKRPKTIKRYGKKMRKYTLTKRPLSHSQLSERTGLALPHIGEIIRTLKNRRVIKEHRGYYKFNKNYDSYRKSNPTYQNGNQGKKVTKMVSKSYRNGNSELPKREPNVTEMVTPTTFKDKPKKKQRTLKESKERLNKERKKILSQIDKLESQFPQDIQPLVIEYIEIARNQNKTGKIGLNREKRLINELLTEWLAVETDDVLDDILRDDFKQALRITVENEAPHINYVKKVIKGLPNKRKVRLKKGYKKWK